MKYQTDLATAFQNFESDYGSSPDTAMDNVRRLMLDPVACDMRLTVLDEVQRGMEPTIVNAETEHRWKEIVDAVATFGPCPALEAGKVTIKELDALTWNPEALREVRKRLLEPREPNPPSLPNGDDTKPEVVQQTDAFESKQVDRNASSMQYLSWVVVAAVCLGFAVLGMKYFRQEGGAVELAVLSPIGVSELPKTGIPHLNSPSNNLKTLMVGKEYLGHIPPQPLPCVLFQIGSDGVRPLVSIPSNTEQDLVVKTKYPGITYFVLVASPSISPANDSVESWFGSDAEQQALLRDLRQIENADDAVRSLAIARLKQSVSASGHSEVLLSLTVCIGQ